MTVKIDDWNRLIREAVDEESETSNFNLPFKKLTKKYGLAYIEYCKAAWSANDGCLTEAEFCALNGGIPKGFFDRKVKI